MRSIPKVVSGLDDVVPGSLSAITRLYGRVFDQVVPVSVPEVAEMTKLYENCQRMMCIAFVNEMADACEPFGINPFEVCDAAATKPFGYMPFSPSLGVGGHCIPVNPYYLLSNGSFPLLEACAEKMGARPAAMADKVLDELSGKRGAKRDSGVHLAKRVLVVGMGFKAGQSHLVNSPGLKLAQELSKFNEVDVMFADSMVEQADIPNIEKLADEDWTADKLDGFDMIVVAFRQWGMDFGVLDKLPSDVSVRMWCH